MMDVVVVAVTAARFEMVVVAVPSLARDDVVGVAVVVIAVVNAVLHMAMAVTVAPVFAPTGLMQVLMS